MFVLEQLINNNFNKPYEKQEEDMNELSEEERQKIIHSPPIGTWALTIIVGLSMVAAWLFIYYGVFLPRGAIG